MSLLGHYETVPVRGTHRKAKIYISSLLKHILVSLAIAFVPFAILLSTRPTPEEVREAFLDPWFLGFTLVILLIALMVFWTNRRLARDARRMVAGELVARTGVLWTMGQCGGRHPGPWRLVIETQDAVGNPLRNEIYNISEELYKRHMEKYAEGGRSYAWLVELAVLPPLGVPEFTEPPFPSPREAPSDPMGFGEMPVSRAEVADIFYLEQQPYGCSPGSSTLFSHW